MTSTQSAAIQGQLGGQDSSRIFHKLFTGHVIAKPAMGWAPLTGQVVDSPDNTDTTCVITIDGFPGAGNLNPTNSQPTFTASFEPRFGSGGAAGIPPGGTPCLAVFPPAGAGSGPPVVLVFFGWPT